MRGKEKERMLQAELALFESGHNSPGCLANAPPYKDHSNANTCGISQNFNNGGHTNLILNSSDNRRKGRRSQSSRRAGCPKTSFHI